MKYTFFDTECAWDKTLHGAYREIDSRQETHRIASKRIIAASALDIDIGDDGQISCKGIASWTEYAHGDELEIVSGLFDHLRGRPDRIAVGYGSVAVDLPVLELASMQHGLMLPLHFRKTARRHVAPGHFDLGLALKGSGKTWHHLSEVILRLGLPATLLEQKTQGEPPKNAAEWAALRAHVELDAALLAIAMAAWRRAQGQAGIDPRTAAFAILDWTRRNGRMTEEAQHLLAEVCDALAMDISLQFDEAA